MEHKYTIVDLKTGKMIADEMTISEFKDWFTYSTRYNNWIQMKNYSEKYATKKMNRDLRIIDDYSKINFIEVEWNSYRFIPIKSNT